MKRERQQRRSAVCSTAGNLRRTGAENPFKARDRAVLVALAEVVIAGHFDDVGDVDEATDHGE